MAASDVFTKFTNFGSSNGFCSLFLTSSHSLVLQDNDDEGSMTVFKNCCLPCFSIIWQVFAQITGHVADCDQTWSIYNIWIQASQNDLSKAASPVRLTNRNLQCAEQVKSPFKLTKYCAINEILSSRFQLEILELLPPQKKKKPIRRHSEHDPSGIRAWSDHDIVISHPPLRRPCSSDLGDVFVLKNTTCRAPAISQNVTKCRACHKSHIPTSPNAAPATQNESHAWSSSHMKHHFQCAQQQKSPSNFTKYCACQAKWISWVIRGHIWTIISNARSK